MSETRDELRERAQKLAPCECIDGGEVTTACLEETGLDRDHWCPSCELAETIEAALLAVVEKCFERLYEVHGPWNAERDLQWNMRTWRNAVNDEINHYFGLPRGDQKETRDG